MISKISAFFMRRKNWTIPYALFLAVFVVMPLLLIVLYAFTDADGAFTFANFRKFMVHPEAMNTFVYSSGIAIITTLACLILGYPAAYILSQERFNTSRTMVVLFILPMWVNILIRTLATVALFDFAQLPLGEGAIDAPIGRRGDSIIGRCVTPEGKPSRTEYTIIKEENGLSLAACVPVTGRTHQIRVHFASIGHPLAGDDLYGASRERIARQALHCARQSFAVPVYTPLPDGIRVEMPLQLRTVTVESPLPPDMEALFS